MSEMYKSEKQIQQEINQELNRLKEINSEMLEMLKDILEQENVSQSAHDEITKLIKKATEL